MRPGTRGALAFPDTTSNVAACFLSSAACLMDIYPLCSHNAIEEEEEEPQPRHQDSLPLWARVCRKEVCFDAAPFPGKQEGKLPTK